MNAKLKWILIGLVVVLVGMQAIRPDRTNPPYVASESITAHVDVPTDVLSTIERSCLDCHSHRTEWPWYSAIAPASWLVARHAEHGREYVNFDGWSAYSAYERQDLYGEIAEVVENGEMPLPMYLPLHPEAKLTEAERAALATWAKAQQARVQAEIQGADGADARHEDEHHGDGHH